MIELEITIEFAAEILQHVMPVTIESIPASQLLERERQRPRISMGTQALDQLFGGHGLTPGSITEFFGVPGIGKTQLGIQLSINCQAPAAHGGAAVAGRAIYIDTEGSFMARRAQQIASGLRERLTRASEFTTAGAVDPAVVPSVNQLLEGITYFRTYDHIELVALLGQLDTFIQQQHSAAATPYRLIVIDSIAFPFRAGFTDMAQRARQLSTVAQLLSQLARHHELVVVLMNQMTTKMGFGSGGGDLDDTSGSSSHQQHQHLVPALGESWGHVCNHRVALYWEHGVRQARVFKSPSLKNQSATYGVDQSGLVDV
ncbi:hypothetical protein IWQ60_011573 [Tieghemiomyces parasiticus]|uniref:DNA repair protein RAD51 homolog 3 n=1 Tax=Tieghemiomyces parasiticus TaxID=78921 RepID=A0A9W7ZN30_9FUNG|nr:hypothetical protein IWQ60_011573 [Tieghemiomyces parasiticus]